MSSDPGCEHNQLNFVISIKQVVFWGGENLFPNSGFRSCLTFVTSKIYFLLYDVLFYQQSHHYLKLNDTERWREDYIYICKVVTFHFNKPWFLLREKHGARHPLVSRQLGSRVGNHEAPGPSALRFVWTTMSPSFQLALFSTPARTPMSSQLWEFSKKLM